MPKNPPFWLPGIHAARRPHLIGRGRIAAAIRVWFGSQDFIEVETAALQVSPGNETHLHAFATDLIGPGGERAPLYLRTSPEFACKAAGRRRDPHFRFRRVFRNRERGAASSRVHFAGMVSRQRALRGPDGRLRGADGRARARGAKRSLSRQDVDPLAARARQVAEAFARHADVDLLATVSGGQGDRASLAAAAGKAGVTIAADDTWGDIFSRILAERVEPQLGNGRATLLYEYPLPLAALARAKPGSDKVAERFELYACGVELANAFGELTDVAEQRARFAAAMREKQRIHGESYPVDEDFLAALEQMPPACGIALGFDRLVMLARGGSRIEQVIWAPVVEI